MGGGLQHGGRIDDLTAHLLGGLIHGGQACAVGIGAVHDTGIHAGFGDLGGDLLDVGAVGDDTGCGQCFLVQSVVGKDLLGVLAHGHIAVAHAEQNAPGLEVLGQRIEAVDALIAILGHAQNDLVLQQVHAGIAVHEVQSFGVHIGGSGAVQLVHLLLTGGDEQVAVRAFLDLGLEGAGGVEVEAEGHVGVLGRVNLADGGEGLGEGCGGKHDQLHGSTGSFRRSSGRACHGRCSAGSGGAAGGQGRSGTGDTGSSQKAAAGNFSVVHDKRSCF